MNDIASDQSNVVSSTDGRKTTASATNSVPQTQNRSSNHHRNEINILELLECPIEALGTECRRKLSSSLNPLKVMSCRWVQRDYRGVLHYLELQFFNMQGRDDPMDELLKQWPLERPTSFAELIRILKQIDRFDVLADTVGLFGKFFLFILSSSSVSVRHGCCLGL